MFLFFSNINVFFINKFLVEEEQREQEDRKIREEAVAAAAALTIGEDGGGSFSGQSIAEEDDTTETASGHPKGPSSSAPTSPFSPKKVEFRSVIKSHLV